MNFIKLFIFFLTCPLACGVLVPYPGIKSVPPVVEAQSLINHWIAKETP